MIRPFSYLSSAGLLAASLLVAGCANGAGPASSTGVEKPDLTVAAVPSADSAGLYIAQQRGLFAAEGLHVKIVPAGSSSTAITDQLAGRYDVTVGGYVSYILADAMHHARLRILAAGSVLRPSSQEVVVPAGSPIQSAAQLRGKSIAVNALDNIGMLLVCSVLADSGVQPSDVHFVPIPFPQMATALAAHRVDAAYLPEPFISRAEMSIGAQPLLDTDQGTTEGLPVSGYIVTQAWADKYPRTAAAFRRAIVAAQTIAGTSLAAVRHAMARFAGVSPMASALMVPPEYPQETDPTVIQHVADLMRKFGFLPQAFDVRRMLA